MRQTLLGNLGSTIDILTTIASHHLQARGVDELTPARARGLLAFDSTTSGNNLELLSASLGQAVLALEGLRLDESYEGRLLDAFAARLARHLATGRDWLLLDEPVASLVTSSWRGPYASWGWLPTFPEATLDELFDIRSRLSEPIERLHRALGFMIENLTDQHSDPAAYEPHDALRETAGSAIEAIATAALEDPALRRISARIPGTAGEPWLSLALIGPAEAGYEPAVRLAGDEPAAATVALAAAWQRHLSDHEVRLLPFFLMRRSSDTVSSVSDEVNRALAAR